MMLVRVAERFHFLQDIFQHNQRMDLVPSCNNWWNSVTCCCQ